MPCLRLAFGARRRGVLGARGLVGLGALLVVLFAPGAARGANVDTAYVTDTVPGTVSAVDTTSNAVTGTIGVGSQPLGIAITPDGQTAYVSNHGSDTVSVIDTATNTVTHTITVGSQPLGVAITPDGQTAYVANASDNTVSVIDTATNTVTDTIPVGAYPVGVAITPDGQHAYVADEGDGHVSVIDTTTNIVSATIPVGTDPEGVAITPDGQRAYVANFGDGTVSVIDTATNTVTDTFAAGGSNPYWVAITPDGQTAYVSNYGSGTVSVIDTATNSVKTTITVGANPVGVAVTSDGRSAYVANFGSNTVSVINTATNLVEATTAVGATPFGVAITPEAEPFVIPPASPSLSMSVPGSGTTGSAILDSAIHASLSGGRSPSGTITFKVFGPRATAPSDCSGGATLGSASVSGNGSYSPSNGFTPTRPGDYWWYASYGGDQNNHPANSGCGASMSKTVVLSSLMVGRVSASGPVAGVRAWCRRRSSVSCPALLTLEATGPGRSGKLVIVGQASASLAAGQAQRIKLGLNSTGDQLLAKRHRLQTKLIVTEYGAIVATKILTFH